MTGFLDLPRRLRERIYREVLVRKGTTSLVDFRNDCNARSKKGHSAPALVLVSPKIDREAAPFYFGGNHFRFETIRELEEFLRDITPRHVHLMSRVTILFGSVDYASKEQSTLERITSMAKARGITVIVNERDIAGGELRYNKAIQWHPVVQVSPQLRLHALRTFGTRALQRLAETPSVELREGDRYESRSFQAAVIAPYTVASPQYERAGTFRFLDLPAELRTRIYHMALVSPGKLCPQQFTARKPPTSVAARVLYMPKYHVKRAEAFDSAPKSAFQLLCCCRQIRDEALGIFYWHNDFIFSSPTPLDGFLDSLTVDRLVHVRNITVFHQWKRERNGIPLQHTLVTDKMLPSLRKLHVLLPETDEYAQYPGPFSGASALFQLRGLKIIEVRDLRLYYGYSKKADQKKSAWRHFNRGLALAQKGFVVRALYEDEVWHQKPIYPVLEGSTCSAQHGCKCPEPPVDEEE